MASTIWKVSVLADGAVLLDGDPSTLERLAAVFDAGPPEGAVVWYYRENAGGEAPPQAIQVMQLIAARRLPVRLSFLPDFSDSVTPETASGMAPLFASIRQRAAGRQLVILRPDGRPLSLAAPERESAKPEAIAAVERMLPSSMQRNVVVIADTSWTMAPTPTMSDAGRAIPFFGLLLGFATIGHAVWIFDGTTAAVLAAGCREADLAIVDSARLEGFPPNWQALLKPVMRNPQILVHDRATFQLRKA
jgi:hypothetical protein